jgi:hypothetical protein
MADAMDAFWGRLGAFADPVNQLADASCGCSFGASAQSVDATAAMSRIVSQYVALSVQGENLRQIMATGVQIPCDVWVAYATARKDYLTKSQAVFDQLSAKGITVEQVVYSQGKPRIDPTDPNKVVTLQVQAPLRPPAFVGITQQCPSAPVMSGFSGALGWERTPIQLGSIPATALTAIGTATTAMLSLFISGTLVGLAGQSAYQTFKSVAVILQDYNSSPSRILAAYTACFQATVKAGVPAMTANKQCFGVQTSAQQARVTEAQAKAAAAAEAASGLGFWGWLGVGAAVVIAGSILFGALRKRLAPMTALLPVGDAMPSLPAGSYSKPSDPILLGDLYYHPRKQPWPIR